MSLPRGALGWSVVSECDISWSYFLSYYGGSHVAYSHKYEYVMIVIKYLMIVMKVW